MAWIVAVAHAAFVAFMAWAPFSGIPKVLVLHVVLTPVLWMHWVLGDDSCVLTVLETWLRGVDRTDSFVHRLVGPVYSIDDAQVRTVSWWASVLLWLVAVSQVRWDDILQAFGVGNERRLTS